MCALARKGTLKFYWRLRHQCASLAPKYFLELWELQKLELKLELKIFTTVNIPPHSTHEHMELTCKSYSSPAPSISSNDEIICD